MGTAVVDFVPELFGGIDQSRDFVAPRLPAQVIAAGLCLRSLHQRVQEIYGRACAHARRHQLGGEIAQAVVQIPAREDVVGEKLPVRRAAASCALPLLFSRCGRAAART